MRANRVVNAVIQTCVVQSAFVKESMALLCGKEETRSIDFWNRFARCDALLPGELVRFKFSSVTVAPNHASSFTPGSEPTGRQLSTKCERQKHNQPLGTTRHSGMH